MTSIVIVNILTLNHLDWFIYDTLKQLENKPAKIGTK